MLCILIDILIWEWRKKNFKCISKQLVVWPFIFLNFILFGTFCKKTIITKYLLKIAYRTVLKDFPQFMVKLGFVTVCFTKITYLLIRYHIINLLQ